MDRQLPSGLRAGRTTPTWTATSVPTALLRAHHTNAWAELIVSAGSVVFVDEEADATPVELTAPASIVIIPQRHHHIEPAADAEFHVQFYDAQ